VADRPILLLTNASASTCEFVDICRGRVPRVRRPQEEFENDTLAEAEGGRRTQWTGCRVVAGPGSGKTRVLVERFCWLVSARGVSPLRVLAITFTEKAATEIKQRLVNAFSGDAKVREQIERAYVSTIHGFCARLLRENSVAAGLDPGFIVMDAPASAAELDHAADVALERLYTERPSEFLGLLDASYFSIDLASCLIHVYHAQRVAGVPLARKGCRPRGEPFRHCPGVVRPALEGSAAKDNTADRRNYFDQDWLERAGTLNGNPWVRNTSAA
jgi:hypothetical protein